METNIVITRTFNASLAQVWTAWTDPALVMRWWGPDRFTSPSAKIDFRVGGTSLVCMRAPEDFGGQDMYSIWTYTKIVPLQCIAFSQSLSDHLGNKVHPTTLGMPIDFPESIPTEASFKRLEDGTTEMIVTEQNWEKKNSMYEFAKMGLEQCMDKMGVLFSSH